MPISGMEKKRRPGSHWMAALPWLAGAGGIVVVGLGAWSLTRHPLTQLQPLPDGTRIGLIGTTYGTQHTCVVGNGWQRLWQGLFPGRSFGNTVVTHPTPRAMPVVWWRLERQPRAVWANQTYQATYDEHGCRFGQAHGEAKHLGVRTLDYVMAQELAVYPRRSATVDLGFFHQRTRQRLAKLTVPNPGTQTHPEWEPEPYPIRKRSGPLALTLHELSHRPTRIRQGSAARFSVTEHGRPTTGWDPVRVETSDATGNSVTTRLMTRDPAGRTWFNGFCTQEKAWKLAVELAPAYPLRVPADFTWELQNVEVPGKGPANSRPPRMERQGISLALQVVRDERQDFQLANEPGVQWLRAIVEVRGTDRNLCLTLLKATDERGRDLSSAIRGGRFARFEGGAQQVYRPGEAAPEFHLRLPRGPKRVNLVFAVHRTHKFVFQAKP